ncbi:MAG: VWA domain-containing protein [Succinimonas sp.]|jgi:uncharacterized protein YegL|nr:VWA domain-containing protein [Succinimonas sp.]
MRRLPVYLLLDTSGSMYGEPIEAVKNGLNVLLSALKSDPYALETAYISIITFNSKVEQIVPLTEINAVTEPSLTASGCTEMGHALSKVAECISNEVVKTSAEQKGDWKPMVFIMTDGGPTDDVDKGIQDFRAVKTGVVVACAAGTSADTKVLKKITENVVSLDSTDSESIKAFFKWVSASVSSGSQKIEESGAESSGMDDLPPPPDEINVVV